MCGIAGIINLDGPNPIALDSLKRMSGALRHRGPDGSGIYLDDWTGLGHTRLSIIDLAGGTQPMHNEDQTLWIVFNGEIFNYLELRAELLKRQHRFYSTSDTEVILHLYEEKGPPCVEDLNGQFAFAIWDARNKRLFLARDRVGIRPLYYTIAGRRLIFASEIKALFTVNDVRRQVDPIALDQVFTFWTTLHSRTVFETVYELPPGYHLEITDGNVVTRKYWDIPFSGPEQQFDCSIDEVGAELTKLLSDAVRIQLRADVPVGAYLSGGLDSSGITALVKSLCESSLKTFGIRFQEAPYDEGHYQEHMVSFLNTDHMTLLADNDAIGDAFSDVIWHCEKPLLRTAPVPLYLLSRAVHNSGIKVVLTGEGADEVFAGYNIFREAKVRAFCARRPTSKLRPLLFRRLYPYIFGPDTKATTYLPFFFGRHLENAANPVSSHAIRWENTSRLKRFFSPRLVEEVGRYDGYAEIQNGLPKEFETWDPVARAQYLEMHIFLSNYLLSSQGDRVAMAHAVEIRVPYLDHRIIELMGRVPSRWKIRGLAEKYLLKKVYERILPEEIVQRPKQPYRAPIRSVFLNEKAPGYVEELLSRRRVHDAGLFDFSKVEMLLKKMTSSNRGNEMDDMALAGILSTQLVYLQFIAGFPAKDIRPINPDLLVDRRSEQGAPPVRQTGLAGPFR
jgi:asparagine synthase (glutamine-hydrolysing)